MLSLMTIYLQGVPTRKVRDVTETLCPASFSKSLVSELTHDLEVDLEAWRGDYPYLRTLATSASGQVISLGVLIATGSRRWRPRATRCGGGRHRERSDHLYDLRRRGLRGVQLVTSDDQEGLKAAISRQFQGVSWQRCQVHFARTRRVRPYLLGRVAKRDRKRLAEESTLEWAREASGKVVAGESPEQTGLRGRLIRRIRW